MTVRILFASFFIATAVAASAKSERYLNVLGERSLIVLGSQDRRYGFGVSYQTLRPEKRLSIGKNEGKLMIEGYLLRTYTDYKPWVPGDANFDTGVLVSGRYEFPLRDKSTKGFWEAGWGLHLSDEGTYDLDSVINSSPTVGVGIKWLEKRPITLTARLMHISNAGSVGRNKGQNQLWIMLGFSL